MAGCSHTYWKTVIFPNLPPDEGFTTCCYCPDCGAQWYPSARAAAFFAGLQEQPGPDAAGTA